MRRSGETRWDVRVQERAAQFGDVYRFGDVLWLRNRRSVPIEIRRIELQGVPRGFKATTRIQLATESNVHIMDYCGDYPSWWRTHRPAGVEVGPGILFSVVFEIENSGNKDAVLPLQVTLKYEARKKILSQQFPVRIEFYSLKPGSFSGTSDCGGLPDEWLGQEPDTHVSKAGP